MMKKLFILACVFLLITSCNSNSKNTNDSATSTETTDMHNAETVSYTHLDVYKRQAWTDGELFTVTIA